VRVEGYHEVAVISVTPASCGAVAGGKAKPDKCNRSQGNERLPQSPCVFLHIEKPPVKNIKKPPVSALSLADNETDRGRFSKNREKL